MAALGPLTDSLPAGRPNQPSFLPIGRVGHFVTVTESQGMILKTTRCMGPGAMTHACNPSCLGGCGWEDRGSRPAGFLETPS